MLAQSSPKSAPVAKAEREDVTSGPEPKSPGAPVEIIGEGNMKIGNGTTPTIIKDVHVWKAGLEVSRGARPVGDLSDFEELEAKL